MVLLEDVVEVPDLDAPVEAGGDDAVLSAGQRDDVQDSLEVSGDDLAESLSLHGPDVKLLPIGDNFKRLFRFFI